MTQPRIRLTTTTVAVVDALLEAAGTGEVMWGFRICELTGLGPGTVYPILDRLERARWVSSSWEQDQPAGRPRRRMFEITGTGREEVAAALAARARSHPVWAIRREGLT